MVPTSRNSRQLTWRAIEQVQQLAALFARRRAQLAAGVGLTEAQWRILEGIASEHFMPSMFAREINQTPGAVSKVLRSLSEKKLIRVSIAEQDGRQRQYQLTARGSRAMKRLRQLRETAIREIWGDLPGEDLQAFVRLSDLLIARIRAYAENEEQHHETQRRRQTR